MNNKINSAVITPVLAAGSVASPYFVQVNISQRLCTPTCADNTPVFAPAFTYKGISQVATGQYVVTIHVEGVISYVPCGGNPCCTRSQVLSQDFTIPLASATEPTSITVAQGATVNNVNAAGCQSCSREFASETPLSITVA